MGTLEIIKPNPLLHQVSYIRMSRKVSRRILNVSREGDSTIPLGSLLPISRLASETELCSAVLSTEKPR